MSRVHQGLGEGGIFVLFMVILRGKWSLWYGSGAGSQVREGARVGVVMVGSMCASVPVAVGLMCVGTPVFASMRLF